MLTFGYFIEGYSLETHKGMMFSAYDEDHDNSDGNCASSITF